MAPRNERIGRTQTGQHQDIAPPAPAKATIGDLFCRGVGGYEVRTYC